MNIQEAIKLALEQDKYIEREAWMGGFNIKPTNTINCCVAHMYPHPRNGLSKAPAPRRGWQPQAEDLVADDWVIID